MQGGLLKYNQQQLKLLYKLIEDAATRDAANETLRKRDLPYSATNWKEVIKKRFSAALEKKDFNFQEDLVDLLRDTEEYGRQHVFLYKCSKAVSGDVIKRDGVERVLNRVGLRPLLKQPRILESPSRPTIVDVRWEQEPRDTQRRKKSARNKLAFVVKVVEERKPRQFIDEKRSGKVIIRRYEETTERAVNLFKLNSDGFLELRIQSHRNSSKYEGEVNRMWLLARDLIPHKPFSRVPLLKAKMVLWSKRTQLRGIMRYSDSSLRNDVGTVLTAATGAIQGDLFHDRGAANSLDEFLRHNGYCHAWNIWWRPGKGKNPPSSEVHTLLPGSVNELVFTANCTKEDYEYVLRKIRTYNQ